MFDKTSASRRRTAIRVRIRLSGQAPFEARVFLKPGERLSDLLNDARGFIPARCAEDETLIVSKSSIVAITELPDPAEKTDGGRGRANSDERRNSGPGANGSTRKRGRTASDDPHDVLGVSRRAPMEEIRKAYKARIKAVHPDAVAAMGLGEEFERAAHLTTQKITAAYQRLVREHERKAETRSDPAPGG